MRHPSGGGPGRANGLVLVGLALTCWTASELYFELVLADEEFTPYPSLGDWLFLAFYPMVYCASCCLPGCASGNSSARCGSTG